MDFHVGNKAKILHNLQITYFIKYWQRYKFFSDG